MNKNTWFTADWHLDHDMVIVYAKRPFLDADGKPDVENMNETLIANTNALVAPEDDLFFLGDISCKSTADRVFEYLNRVNGKKYWVPGNHDKTIRKSAKLMGLFEWAKDLTEISIPTDPTNKHKNQRIVLCHYAMRTWNRAHFGAWQLHGHSHGNLADDPHSLQVDVGVDCWNYAPVSFDTLLKKMATKTFKPIDHHGQKAQHTNP